MKTIRVAAAVIFCWDADVIKSIFFYFARNIHMLIILIISAVISFFFVLLGPRGIAGLFKKHF